MMKQIIVLACVICVVVCINPGLKPTVREAAIYYMVGQYMPIIHKKISQLHIPDVHVSDSLIDYDITSTNMQSISFNTPRISLLDDRVIQINVDSCQAILTCDWGFEKFWRDPFGHKHHLISDHGDATITLQISAQTRLQINIQEKKPAPVAVISVNVQDVKVKVDAGWYDFIYNFLLREFQGTLKDKIQTTLQENLQKAVDEGLEHLIPHIHLNVTLGDFGTVDYGLTEVNVVPNGYLATGLLGQVTSKSGQLIPINPKLIPDTSTSHPDSMLQVGISDAVLNSLILAWYTTNKTSIIITNDMIPKDVTIRLKTSYFNNSVPILLEKFGEKDMQVIASYGKSPVISTDTSRIRILNDGFLKFQVNVSSDSMVDVFTLGVSLPLNTTLHVKSNATSTGMLVDFDYPRDDVKVYLSSSQIGKFDPAKVDSFVKKLIRVPIAAAAKYMLLTEFPIPLIPGMALSNPNIELNQGYVRIISNFTYSPEPN
jgi:hypothetical protein